MWTPLPTCFCVLNRFFTVRFQLKENFIATEYNILDNMCSKFGERLQHDNSPRVKMEVVLKKLTGLHRVLTSTPLTPLG